MKATVMSAIPKRKQAHGLTRAMNRQGVESKKATAVVVHEGLPRHPSVCDGCAAVYSAKQWHRGLVLANAALARAEWTQCPACRQVEAGEYQGRLLLRGLALARNEREIRNRIRNVEARSSHTQPERRVVSIERDRDGLEVLTTSQKLTHRIAREIEKAFLGKVEYAWTDNGQLLATWNGDEKR